MILGKRLGIGLSSLLLMSLCYCNSLNAEILKWDTTELVLAGSLVTLSVADAYQTSQFNKYGLQEGNPLIKGVFGNHPNFGEVILVKAAIVIPILAASHWFIKDHKIRKMLLGVTSAGQLGVCIYNEAMAGGIVFRF